MTEMTGSTYLLANHMVRNREWASAIIQQLNLSTERAFVVMEDVTCPWANVVGSEDEGVGHLQVTPC